MSAYKSPHENSESQLIFFRQANLVLPALRCEAKSERGNRLWYWMSFPQTSQHSRLSARLTWQSSCFILICLRIPESEPVFHRFGVLAYGSWNKKWTETKGWKEHFGFQQRQKCPAVDTFLGHTAALVGSKPPRPWISLNHQSHRWQMQHNWSAFLSSDAEC